MKPFQSFLYLLLACVLIINAVSIFNLTETDVNGGVKNNKAAGSSSSSARPLDDSRKSSSRLRPRQDTSCMVIGIYYNQKYSTVKNSISIIRYSRIRSNLSVGVGTLQSSPPFGGCVTIVAGPSEGIQFEGISAWIAQVVVGFIVAKQARCQSFYIWTMAQQR